MSKHTPGPWDVEESRQKGRITYQIGARDGDSLVADVDGYVGCVEGPLRRLPSEENEANAHLIAAAPEQHYALLKCEALLERYRSGAFNPPGKERDSVLLEVRAVIAKAEGR